MQAKKNREKKVRDSKITIILDAARDVFVRLGYHFTRLEDIADTAGFTKTALYYYFEDKEEIFLSLCLRELDRMIARVQDVRKLPMDFPAIFTEIVRIVVTTMGEHFSFLLMMVSFKMPENPGGFFKYKKEIRQFKERKLFLENTFLEMISEMKKRGEINCDIDENHIANYLGSLIRGVLFRWYCDGQAGDTEKEIGDLLKFILPALRLTTDVTLNHDFDRGSSKL